MKRSKPSPWENTFLKAELNVPLPMGEGVDDCRTEKTTWVRAVLLVFAFCIFNFAFSATAEAAFDPLTIGIGARALGMGKAYLAVADDCDTIFSNPAGLGEIDTLKFTSMAGTLLEEVNYTVLGGVHPLGKQSAIGIGYVNSFVQGIEIRDSSGTLLRKATFGSGVLLASFGKKISEKTAWGLNLKYYFSDGSEIDAGDGSGWNMDLGILQNHAGWLSIGCVASNLIGSSRITYKNGGSEAIPAGVKAGARAYLLGSSIRSAFYAPVELSLALDSDLYLQNARVPTLHGGIEFSPSPLLILRAGFDRSDLTAGATVQLAGLGFHYAYDPAAQYFSITFDERGWPPEEEKPSDVFWGNR
jgi:hypothetical protein